MNHTRLPVTGSPIRLNASGQQGYKERSCRIYIGKLQGKMLGCLGADRTILKWVLHKYEVFSAII